VRWRKFSRWRTSISDRQELKEVDDDRDAGALPLTHREGGFNAAPIWDAEAYSEERTGRGKGMLLWQP
jgi:hypothetical protein